MVAASREPDFPDELNHLLLRVAVDQAAVVLHQKQGEEQLRRKQEELSDFLDNASEGLHWVGPDGIIIWTNPAELDMLGYRREEYLGRHFSEFHADQFIAEDLFQRLINDQPVRDYEARLRCKDGSIRQVLINSSVYRENGKFIRTRCFTRDITERRQMEASLRSAYDELEMRVEYRTKELSAAIDALKDEIAIRKRVELEVAELRGRLAEGAGASLLESTRAGIMQVIGTLRNLCEELRPSTLTSSGLAEAIRIHGSSSGSSTRLLISRSNWPRMTIPCRNGHA